MNYTFAKNTQDSNQLVTYWDKGSSSFIVHGSGKENGEDDENLVAEVVSELQDIVDEEDPAKKGSLGILPKQDDEQEGVSASLADSGNTQSPNEEEPTCPKHDSKFISQECLDWYKQKYEDDENVKSWGTDQVSNLKTYSIPLGTILYCTSNKKTFNPNNFKLDDDSSIYLFTDSDKLAESYTQQCKNFPEVDEDYIHMFEVTVEIDNILILSPYDLIKSGMIKDIGKKICSNNIIYSTPLNGVGFMYPDQNTKRGIVRQFSLCNPNRHLKYMSTKRCRANLQFGDYYKFN